MKLTKTRERVAGLLTVEPTLRDNDFRLISNIWHQDVKNRMLNPDEMSATEFLTLLSQGALTNSESIRRCRQALQQKYPEEFLGTMSLDTKQKLQEDVRSELRQV